MISDAIALFDLVRRAYKGRKILSALFDPEGKCIEGDERIKVRVHRPPNNQFVWFYEVEPFENYQFVRIPVNPSAVIEALGQPEGKPSSTATTSSTKRTLSRRPPGWRGTWISSRSGRTSSPSR